MQLYLIYHFFGTVFIDRYGCNYHIDVFHRCLTSNDYKAVNHTSKSATLAHS